MADGCAPGPLKQGIKKSKETSRKKSADYQCMMPTISECKLKAQPPASDSSGNSFDEAGETAFQVKRADGTAEKVRRALPDPEYPVPKERCINVLKVRTKQVKPTTKEIRKISETPESSVAATLGETTPTSLLENNQLHKHWGGEKRTTPSLLSDYPSDSESVVSLSVHPGSKHKVQRCFKSKDKETDFPKMTVAQLMREELKRMKMEMKQAENESNLVENDTIYEEMHLHKRLTLQLELPPLVMREKSLTPIINNKSEQGAVDPSEAGQYKVPTKIRSEHQCTKKKDKPSVAFKQTTNVTLASAKPNQKTRKMSICDSEYAGESYYTRVRTSQMNPRELRQKESVDDYEKLTGNSDNQQKTTHYESVEMKQENRQQLDRRRQEALREMDKKFMKDTRSLLLAPIRLRNASEAVRFTSRKQEGENIVSGSPEEVVNQPYDKAAIEQLCEYMMAKDSEIHLTETPDYNNKYLKGGYSPQNEEEREETAKQTKNLRKRVHQITTTQTNEPFTPRWPENFQDLLLEALCELQFTKETVVSSKGYSVTSLTITRFHDLKQQ